MTEEEDRDSFAMAALNGLITADVNDRIGWERMAELAYEAADAMIAERNKQTGNDK